MRLVVLGLSLSSSWGNGHATTYRALLRALRARGHDLLFLEREQPWYRMHRDLPDPDFCDLRFYESVDELKRYKRVIREADAVIVGSYVPEGREVISLIGRWGVKLFCFYDIDTPVTLAALARDGCSYIARHQVSGFGLYLSFTGGPILRELERTLGARMARPLYCAADPSQHAPKDTPIRWHLGYLGTHSADRQPTLERLLIEPARKRPDLRFVVAGPLYPADLAWPDNVDRIEHVPPGSHADFYASLGWTLNITRADMRRYGFSPSVRLFEAGACAAPIITDDWPGLPEFFRPGAEIVVADDAEAVLAALAMPERQRRAIGDAGRARTLGAHTASIRAAELESHLEEARRRRGGGVGLSRVMAEGVQA